jgi:tetratricopeptide (TPR) repeat protein
MRAGPVASIACTLLLIGCVERAHAQSVHYERDIAPLVGRACVGCHRAGGDAPFGLESFDAVRQRARVIAEVTRRRVMPPWKPEPGHGDFRGDRRLGDDEIALFGRWVAQGAPRGPSREGPSRAPDPADARLHEGPTLVLTLPAFTLRAEGPDVFRNFVIPVPLDRARFVRALVFRPGHPAVHHANIRIDRTNASRRLDEADPTPGYEGVILRSADFPDGHFLGWTPGQVTPGRSDELSWPLAPPSDLVVQVHLRPTGAPEVIAPTVALYLGDVPPARQPAMIRLGRQNLDIPPDVASHRVVDAFVLPVDAEVHAIQPHAHYRARAVEAWADLPDGTRRPLIRIAQWDPGWQDRYLYTRPFWLPAGSRVTAEYVFDNTAGNPRNPELPPRRAGWGWRAVDEMGDLWIQVLTRSDADRSRLQRAAAAHMQSEDVIGSEVLLGREPDHVALRNDAATTYMDLGRPSDALRHFEAVTRLEPLSARGWYNAGVALEALNRMEEASARYERAVALEPTYSSAHNNLGTIRLRQGRTDAARAHFARAVEADPANAEARANLGLALIDAGDPDRAIIELERAIALQPSRLAQSTAYVWLLASHPTPTSRRPDAAHRLAERIVAATDRAAGDALDALAASLAALGRYDEAERAALEALERTASDSARQSIGQRIALYRARRPFVLAK